jgi:hypothetical protein
MFACLDDRLTDTGWVDEAAKRVNEWGCDGTLWKNNLDDAQVRVALEILERIHRGFQAGIGDPLPPHD